MMDRGTTDLASTGADHRRRPRRRGRALLDAIFRATLEELAERGYSNLNMERIAARARVSKASLYRRWRNRMELVMDAVRHAIPEPAQIPDTGSLRGDLVAALQQAAQFLEGPAGEALPGLLSDAFRDPERTAEMRRRAQASSDGVMWEILRRAARRGEIDLRAVTPCRMEVGQALLRNYFLFRGSPIPDRFIDAIVDEVILPLLRASPQANGESAPID